MVGPIRKDSSIFRLNDRVGSPIYGVIISGKQSRARNKAVLKIG